MAGRQKTTQPRSAPAGKPAPKPGLHPRNRHRDRYPFPELVVASPALAPFVAVNAYGDPSIDFANPEAVKALNRALLRHFYGIQHWELPPGYLCPPIPGRADYLHYLADLLAGSPDRAVPRGPQVRVLDIGVGANCIYPLLGQREYGWRFLGSDIDAGALAGAQNILAANPGLEAAIELRRQPDPGRVFQGLLRDGERFDLTLCNPPFHASAAEAREGSERKWRNLGRATAGPKPVLNFGGRGAELWCPGGEAGFVVRMVEESAALGDRCLWFSTLIAREASLPSVYAALKAAGAQERRTVPMAQGQKKSRFVAWTFLKEAQRQQWARDRGANGNGRPAGAPREPGADLPGSSGHRLRKVP